MEMLPAPQKDIPVQQEEESTEDMGENELKRDKKKEEYAYEGYQIRVHFRGDKTLIQCIRNLVERRNETGKFLVKRETK